MMIAGTDGSDSVTLAMEVPTMNLQRKHTWKGEKNTWKVEQNTWKGEQNTWKEEQNTWNGEENIYNHNFQAACDTSAV